MAFQEFGFEKLGLTVFDFNKSAFKCYEKAGFQVSGQEIRPNGWVAIKMEIVKPIFQNYILGEKHLHY
jgi:RimJ/RimL family protein N-acetyltransferase